MASLIPILWSKLDSPADVTSPQLGSAGTVHGSPTFPGGYFGNAIYSNLNNANYITFPLGGLSMSKGTIEFWSKLEAAPPPGTYYFWSIGNATDSIYFEYHAPPAAAHRLRVYVFVGGIAITNCWIGIPKHYPRFNPLNCGCPLTHIAIVWDRQGNDIGGGRTLAIYLDNILRASSLVGWAEIPPAGDLILLNRFSLDKASCASIDNLKVHAVCKIDFNDRGIEDFCRGEDFKFGHEAAPLLLLVVEDKIRLFSYTCPKDGYPVKICCEVSGPASPSVGWYAYAIYDASKKLLCSTYGQHYSSPCQEDEWPILAPLIKLETGKTYYFAVWGGNWQAKVCTNGTRADWLKKDRGFIANFPNWPDPFIPDAEGGGIIFRNEPVWHVVLNSQIGELPLIPQAHAPYDLLCEQKTNPTDVTDPQPEFSAMHHYE